MKVYLAKKFKEDSSDRKLIEEVSDALGRLGIEMISMARDYEKWGQVVFTPSKLMQKTFAVIDSSDVILVEFSEKGVGVGMEVGYAVAKGKSVYVIAKSGSDISTTLKGVAKEIVFYDNVDELSPKLGFLR